MYLLISRVLLKVSRQSSMQNPVYGQYGGQPTSQQEQYLYKYACELCPVCLISGVFSISVTTVVLYTK